MRKVLFAFAALAVFATATVQAASAPTIVMPAQMKWQAQKDGSAIAVVYGNPDKGGMWVTRFKMPANYTYPPHHHPDAEYVTVLSGTVYAGMGSKINMSKAMALPAGAFAAMMPNAPHWVATKGQPAVLEISGTGVSKDVMEK